MMLKRCGSVSSLPKRIVRSPTFQHTSNSLVVLHTSATVSSNHNHNHNQLHLFSPQKYQSNEYDSNTDSIIDNENYRSHFNAYYNQTEHANISNMNRCNHASDCTESPTLYSSLHNFTQPVESLESHTNDQSQTRTHQIQQLQQLQIRSQLPIIKNSTQIGSNSGNLQLTTISKRFARFTIPRHFDVRGKPDISVYNLRRKKQEVINTEPLTQFIYHKVPSDWQLIRTTPPNPRQLNQVKAWTPVEGLRKLRSHTGGTKNAIIPDYTCLWTHGAAKSLIARIFPAGGREYTGQITTRHRGFGKNHKYFRYYRVIDFKRSILDEEGIVERIEFDPNRSAYIALVRYPESKRISYIIAVDGLKPGDPILSTREKPPKFFRPGFAMPLKFVPAKASICCIECEPGKGAQMIRSAGTYAKLLNKDGPRKGYGLVELQSKELKLIPLDSMCTLGRISNPFHCKINWGSAGRRRRRGWRPSVRGVAMNPRDHPHGGGTKHKRARPEYGGGLRTYTGKHMLGFKTRKERKLRVPVEYQQILKRRPRNWKKGQLF